MFFTKEKFVKGRICQNLLDKLNEKIKGVGCGRRMGPILPGNTQHRGRWQWYFIPNAIFTHSDKIKTFDHQVFDYIKGDEWKEVTFSDSFESFEHSQMAVQVKKNNLIWLWKFWIFSDGFPSFEQSHMALKILNNINWLWMFWTVLDGFENFEQSQVC